MPPKKKTAEDAEPPAQSSEEEPSKDEAAGESGKEAPASGAVLRLTKAATVHPKYTVMVEEALKALDSRKGVTAQAIRNYIQRTYPNVDVRSLARRVRGALARDSPQLLKLDNPNPSGHARYRLAPKVKEAARKGENADPNEKKEAKPPEKGAKKSGKEGGKTKKSPASDKDKPQREKKPKKDEATETPLETIAVTKKPSRKTGAEKSLPSAKPRAVKASKVPKATVSSKGKEAKAARPGRAKKSPQ